MFKEQKICSSVLFEIEAICSRNELPVEKARLVARFLLGRMSRSMEPKSRRNNVSKFPTKIKQQMFLTKKAQLVPQEIFLNVRYELENICIKHEISLRRVKMASVLLIGQGYFIHRYDKLPRQAIKLWSARSCAEMDMEPQDFYRKYWGPFRSIITLSYLEQKDYGLVRAIRTLHKWEAKEYLPPCISEREQAEQAKLAKEAKEEKEREARVECAKAFKEIKRQNPEIKKWADQYGL